MSSIFDIASCQKRRKKMTKISQKKQVEQDTLTLTWGLTSTLMHEMVGGMVSANVPHKTILEIVKKTKSQLDFVNDRFCPDHLAKSMFQTSSEKLDYYGQDWLNEYRDEIGKEKSTLKEVA